MGGFLAQMKANQSEGRERSSREGTDEEGEGWEKGGKKKRVNVGVKNRYPAKNWLGSYVT